MNMDESTWSKVEYKGETGQSAAWLYSKKILWYMFKSRQLDSLFYCINVEMYPHLSTAFLAFSSLARRNPTT
jgi:hypothetical protein